MGGAIINIPTGLSLEAISDGFFAAAPDGLVYLNYFGVDLLERDLSGNQEPSILGNPPVSGRWVECGGNYHGVTPGFDQPDDFTYMAVFRQVVQTSGMIMGNYSGASAGGAWLFVTNDLITLAASIGGSIEMLNDPSMLRVANGTPYLVCGQYDSASELRRLECPTLESSVEDTGGVIGANSSKPRVGASYATFSSDTDIAFAAAWDRVLTSEEKNKMYAQVRAFMTANGITV